MLPWNQNGAMSDNLLLLTEREVADILRISIRNVRYIRAAGDLAYVRVGRQVRYRRSDVIAFIERNVCSEMPAVTSHTVSKGSSAHRKVVVPFSQRKRY